MATIPEALTLALQHHRSGDLQRAEAIYRQVLAVDPNQADAIHLLGMIAHQVGRHDLAVSYIKQAIGLQPENGIFHFNLGLASTAAGRLDEATASYRQALRLRPHDPVMYLNLANILADQGQFDEAVAYYSQLLAINPNDALANFNLGNAQRQQGKLQDAVASYLQAILLKPDYEQAHNNLGNVYQSLNQLEQAVEHYRQALAVNPGLVQANNNLGTALRKLGRLGEAVECYRRALALRPDLPEIYKNLAGTLADQQNLAEAVVFFEKAVALKPDMAEAHAGLGVALNDLGREDEGFAHLEQAMQLKPNDRLRVLLATRLPPVYQSMADLESWRQRLVQGIDSLHSRGVVLDLTEEPALHSFYAAYQGLNDRDIQRRTAKLYRAPQPILSNRAVTGKIKIGFLSRFFRNHTIGHLMRGLVAELARDSFAATVLSLDYGRDEVAGFFRQHADCYLEVPRHLPSARRLIAEQQLDVLLYADIGMEPISYSLAFSRLAPVQCVTWGHPETTGIDTVDYFISAEALETEGAEDCYTEQLIRPKTLPIFYYRPQLPSPLRQRGHFGLSDEDHVYACPQTLFKFHPEFDEILAGILRSDPKGVLVLLKSKNLHWEQMLRQRFAVTLPDVLDRIRFLSPLERGDFVNLMAVSDVLLDPLHFGGGNTSYEAFAVGTPIVTLPSRFLRGRITLALYKQMDVLDCVAYNSQDYIRIALRLGTDFDYRESLRQKILAASAVLYENKEGIRELELFFQQAVCGQKMSSPSPRFRGEGPGVRGSDFIALGV